MQKSILFLLIALIFSACFSKNSDFNPLGRSFGAIDDIDPLKLGANPTIPEKQETPSLIDGSNLVPLTPLNPPLLRESNDNKDFTDKPRPMLQSSGEFNEVSVFANRGFVSDYMSIMSSAGPVLTVWALAPGNWIWGYTLINSKSFGDARVWQMIEFPLDFVMIKNAKTHTCLNAYRNGVVHYPCDQSNQAQFWKMIPMSNQSFQFQNLQTKTCLKTTIGNPMGDFFKVFPILLGECVKPGDKNLDQQWFAAPPPFSARPVYREKP
ncbi:RICIN domain-containing protein [Campylobacter insulaenigrae]|uniref:RICIN domain-containing protein n=1 Tax=Campylobacter insulaenigrae TaxID=260714 RepID=UPI00215395BF|nr:RICIN domain-containing protein [Campylobacter insulaenigrae]MCR6576833.1 cytolethal distending toxin subunit A [Campylobacter insulaenigrae]